MRSSCPCSTRRPTSARARRAARQAARDPERGHHRREQQHRRDARDRAALRGAPRRARRLRGRAARQGRTRCARGSRQRRAPSCSSRTPTSSTTSTTTTRCSSRSCSGHELRARLAVARARRLEGPPVRAHARQGAALNFAQVVFAQTYNVLYQQRMTDMNTMFKVFRAECLDGARPPGDGFELDIELACKLARTATRHGGAGELRRARLRRGKEDRLLARLLPVGPGRLQVPLRSPEPVARVTTSKKKKKDFASEVVDTTERTTFPASRPRSSSNASPTARSSSTSDVAAARCLGRLACITPG